MPPQAKRRRRQSSVLSFFQADPPTPPSIPSSAPPSIPSAPPSATTASPVKPVCTESALALHDEHPSESDSPIKPCSVPTESSDETQPPSGGNGCIPETPHKPLFSVCTVPSVAVDITPTSTALSVCALPGVEVITSLGSPVTPDGVNHAPKEYSKHHVEDIDDIDDEDDWQPVSRLSRSRNIARRSARLRAARCHQSDEYQGKEIPPDAEFMPVSSSEDRFSEDDVVSEGTSRPSSPMPRKVHLFFSSKDRESASKLPQQKKLHPFFAATAAAVSNARERKRPRVVVPSTDAWQCRSATVHINAPPMSGSFPLPKPTATQPPKAERSVAPVEFCCYTREPVVDLRPVEKVPCENSDTWAERYKRDRRIDVINGAATKELMDWLRDWYETRKQTEISDDSQDSYAMPADVAERERVAIVTGPVGCGKTTMISNAARQLGLCILEINASVCRTGKRIREIIGEALSTHRVTHRSMFQSFKPKAEPTAKTLILFEEVDELYDDEKGFWSTIQKLAASTDCRRPIVCTANSFTSHMRQYFVQSVGTVEDDLDRLLINSRVEQLVNPIEYKLIEFQSRSERQATAVIHRVCITENADAVKDIANSLALACRDDTRKAINMLHFWGAEGLAHEFVSSPRRTRGSPPKRGRHGHLPVEIQSRIGTQLVKAALPDADAFTEFHVGSCNYSNNRATKKTSSAKPSSPVQVDDTLNAWSTSLEALSDANAIEGVADQEKSRRSFALSEEPLETCIHSELDQAEDAARDIAALSLKYSAAYLSFEGGARYVNEIAKETPKGLSALRNQLPEQVPLPRRPMSMEYLPILRTMALANDKACSGAGSTGDGHDRPMRRTRARARHGGFCSLDLDPITILALKKRAIRTSENQNSFCA